MLVTQGFQAGSRQMAPEDPAPEPDDGVADAWTVSLDEVGPARPAAAGVTSAAPARRRRAAVAALGAVALLFGLAWLPWPGGGDDEPARQTVAGESLAAPVSLRLPLGAVTTADRSYVGLKLYEGRGGAMVTVPTQVVEPSGVRSELPADPARWLMEHPKLFVSRVRQVSVAGQLATQVDYRLSREASEGREFSSVPLFCGWKREVDPSGLAGLAACTRITTGARVRTTFVPVGGRVVVIEAVWPAEDSPNGRMPRELGFSYRALLNGVTADR
jgi:hypothetical protein